MPSPRRAALILVDGLRPDALSPSRTPALDALRRRGLSNPRSRSVMPSVTLPCHTTLFYGVPPGRHGITTNAWHPFARPVPSLLDVLHAAGHRTFMWSNWEQLRDMGAPGSLTEASFVAYHGSPGDESDRRNFRDAARRLARGDFGFAFLYYGLVDVVGHSHGWMSRAYLRQVARADRAIAGVLGRLPKGCLVLATSDHGGHDHTHGTEADEDMNVPLLAAGPGLPRGRPFRRPTSLLDLAPTLAAWLGVARPREWAGKPLFFPPP
jgi:predicted AlkP superfamily pyrophosphatase or phosphodiesterase